MILRLKHFRHSVGAPIGDIFSDTIMVRDQAQLGVVLGIAVFELAIAFQFSDACLEEGGLCLVEPLRFVIDWIGVSEFDLVFIARDRRGVVGIRVAKGIQVG